MRLRAVRTAVNRAVVAVVCAASSALAGWCILLTAWEPEMEIPVLETGPAADASRPGAGMFTVEGRVVGSDQDASRAGLRRGVAVPQPGRQPPALNEGAALSLIHISEPTRLG